MDIRPIRNDNDLDEALREIDSLMGAEPGTAEGDRLEVLATLVEAYEKRHHAVDLPDPIEAILHAMEAKGLTQADLAPAIGRAQVADVLKRRRALTLPMIRVLSPLLGVSIEVLAQPYPLQSDAA